LIALVLLLSAGAALAAAPQTAAVDLRSVAGQPVKEEDGLVWKYAEVVVEWGFQKGTENLPFDGNIQSTYLLGQLGTAKPLPGDRQTTMTGPLAWKSPAGGESRRGIVVPVLYTPAVRGPARTIVTVRTASGSFSFQPVDLEAGPILASDYGFFVSVPGQPAAKPPTPSAHKVGPLPTELLTSKVEDREGTTAVSGWGSKQTPCVWAHAGAGPGVLLGGAIHVPPRSIAVHPGPDCDVAVGWRSPIAGKVNVKAKVTDAHPSGGNGVEWSIVHDAQAGRKVLARGAIDRGGAATIPVAADADKLAAVVVQPGDLLSLAIGNRGDHTCDTTSIELTIAEVGDKPRAWDLARDVVENIQAGNPHADSLGNAAVWHFYAPGQLPGQGRPWRPAKLAFESRATTAREYLAELAAHKPKTIRQQVREHAEQTWEGAMRSLYGNQPLPPIPAPPFDPAMSVEVPDQHLTALWRVGAWRIIRRCPRIDRADMAKVGAAGDVTNDCRRIDDPKDPRGIYVVRDNPFPPLGCETDRILWALDHLGMHQVAADGMAVWLENQPKDGCLSLNSGIEQAHKIGALQILWVMTEHYRLTGDRQWLQKESPRLKAAADWILQRRRATMKGNLTPDEIKGIQAGTWSPFGLQPKVSMGDGDPSGSRYYYWADACGYRSVKLLAEVIGDIDPKLGADYAAEAEKYRQDILPVLEESIVLSPVIRVRDGTARSFHPQGFQDRGPLAQSLPVGRDIYTHCGPYHADYCITAAAIEAWLKTGLLAVDDVRIDGHFDVLEDDFLLDHPWFRRRKKDYDPEKDWFNFGWSYQSGWERLPEYYLVKDDVPNFLRSWLNRCAVDINLSDYSFNEHTTFAANDKSHGKAVFLSNFRNMLVMEIGDSLWLARATPRAWLEQGKRISVRNSPTYFGTVAYEIVSDVDHGKITATVEMPSRKTTKEVLLRLRHPKVAPIKSVTINGRKSNAFDATRELVRLGNVSGKVAVTVSY
jgi:hypothetical protein